MNYLANHFVSQISNSLPRFGFSWKHFFLKSWLLVFDLISEFRWKRSLQKRMSEDFQTGNLTAHQAFCIVFSIWITYQLMLCVVLKARKFKHYKSILSVISNKMIPKVGATAGCPPAHSLLPSQAAAEELKTMLHFMGHFHARSGRYLSISKQVL